MLKKKKKLVSGAGAAWSRPFWLELEQRFCLEPVSTPGPRTSGAAQKSRVAGAALFGWRRFLDSYVIKIF